MAFSQEDLDLLQKPAFAALALQLPNGSLQNTLMWYRVEGNSVQMIAPSGSTKARALRLESNVSLAIHDPENSYDYIEIRGQATVVEDDQAARAALRKIARRYIGDRADAYVDGLSDAERVLIVVDPARTRHHRGANPGAATVS